MIGKLISHYKILEELGRGGMGVVYKAEDFELKRFVALKFVHPELTEDAEARERFVTEARRASVLDHANICTIYEIGRTDDNQAFISMAYYEGETLAQKLQKGPLETQQAIEIAIQVADGLAKAHAAGIVHRDINPANVMLTNDGQVKILDFGLAKLDGQPSSKGRTLAAIDYMSPELIQNKEFDHRTDTWSLGVLLYEMLNGRPPFHGQYDQEVMYSILQEDHVSLTEQRADVPKELDEVLTKALAKRKEARYKSAHEFREVLDSLSDSGPRRVSAAGARGRGRYRWITAVSLLLVILLAAGFALFFGSGENQPPADFSQASKRIAILPFNVRGSEKMQDFGEGIVNLLSANLDGAGDLSVVSPHALLTYVERHGLVNLDQENGKLVAEQFGAGLYLVGNLVEGLEKLDAVANFVQIEENGRLKKRAGFRVEASQIFDLVDRLSREIISALSDVPSKRLLGVAARTTNSFSALKAYLEGERHFRSGNFYEAIAFYDRAISSDSTFALAYLRLANASGLVDNPDKKPYNPIKKALSYIDRLPDRYRRLAIALNEQWNGNFVLAEKQYRELVSLYPDEMEAWWKLGVLLFNTSGRRGHTFEDARFALERTVDLDPTNFDALEFLRLIAALEERSAECDSLAQLLVALETGDNRNIPCRAQLACVGGNEKTKQTAIEELSRAKGFELYFVALHFARMPRLYDDALTLGKMLTAPTRSERDQIRGHIFLAHMAILLGRVRESKSHFAAARAVDDNEAITQNTILSLIPLLQHSERDIKELSAQVARLKPSLHWVRIYRAYLLGHLSVLLGDYSSALSQADRLQSEAATFKHRKVAGMADDFGDYVRIHVAWKSGQIEQALKYFEQTHPEQWWQFVAFDLYDSQPFERFMRAELLKSIGRYDEALRWFGTLGAGSALEFVYLPVSHLKRAQLYEEMGQVEKAQRHYSRFMDFWQNCDPELRPLVDDARSRVERLQSVQLSENKR